MRMEVPRSDREGLSEDDNSCARTAIPLVEDSAMHARLKTKLQSIPAIIIASSHLPLETPPNTSLVSSPFKYPSNSSNNSTVSAGLATQAVVHAFLYH
jgi:hypothetical protein